MSNLDPLSYALQFAFSQITADELEKSRKFHTEEADGESPANYMYDAADSVRQASIKGYVHITYKGIEYRTKRVTPGAFEELDKKSTVLVQLHNGLWYKLWFYDDALGEPPEDN